jgi:NADPH2:quinone reductase
MRIMNRFPLAESAMFAWLCENPTGPESVTWKELPTPEPRPGEVRVAIKAASLNFPDLLIVQNKYQMKPPLPFVPGSEFAGVVEAVGDGVTHLKPGDAVAAFSGTGGFATHACVDAAVVMPLPPGFAFDDAAAFVLTYGTTHHALLDRGALKAGETLLVLGAAGGVGLAAVELGALMGARVIAAASTDEKLELCRSRGATETINYRTEDFRARVKELTEGRGVDVVYDPVGGDLSEPALRSMAWKGRFLVIGFAAGDIPKIPLNLPLLKGCSVVGVFWGAFTGKEPERNAANIGQLLEWLAEGKVVPHVSSTHPLERAAEAISELAGRRATGKVVVTP